MTPSANLVGIASHGIVQILTDPRITLIQSLEAILIIELTDCDGWASLIELAHINADDESADRFEKALEREEEHLAKVRRWLAVGQGRLSSNPTH